LSRKPAATSGSVVAIANFRKVAACSVRYFLPGTIWFPATTRCYPPLPIDYALRRNPFRKKSTKVNSRQRAASRPDQTPAQEAELSVGVSLAQEFPGFLVDEMKPGAGEADRGHIGIGIGLVLRRGRRKPMLYVRAQPRAFEKDMSAHKPKKQNFRGGSPPYGCVVPAPGEGKRGCVQDVVRGFSHNR